jgi:thiaminase (transcriptional activator TenA)
MATRFTDDLRAAAGDQWTRIITHKFTTELAAGIIPKRVLATYLIQDHRFLDAFSVLLASMIAHTKTLSDRIPACQFLALITGEENTYFERSFVALDLDQNHRDAVPNAEVTNRFIDLMISKARSGSLGEMLAVLIVCEWTYLSWGQLVKEGTKRDDFVCYEWVDLHCGDYFAGVVEYLRGLLDQESQSMDREEKGRCRLAFLAAVQLEEDFFNYVYN